MSAANLQGVPGSTIDVDLWLDLPSRQYLKAINLALRTGAQAVRNTVVELADGTLVNFIYEVTGLPAFQHVIGKAKKINWHGIEVAVLPLDLIVKSKEAIRRPKDLLHIELIRQRLAVMKKNWKMNLKNHKFGIEDGNWLPDMDLNHDKQIQSLLCYHYTIGQNGALRLPNSPRQSSSRSQQ